MYATLPQLAELQSQLAAAKTDAAALVAGLTETQFNWRPGDSQWSIAECLLHLNIVGDRYVHVLDPALADARTQGRLGQGPFSLGPVGRWILANTEPPPKRRFKAPRMFSPAYGQPLTAVMPTFFHLQDQLQLQLDRAGGLDLARIKVPAPGLGPFRLSLHLTFAWIAAHQRRHLWQARQVRQHPAFPQPRAFAG